MLGLAFLTHLSYFLIILILLLVSIAMILEREAKRSLLWDLAKVIGVSQLVALLWWLPRNLYWWWINALVTSSGMYPLSEQLHSYGLFTAVLGALAFLYLPFLKKHRLLILLWTLPLIIETQNEPILFAIKRADLTWHTLFKPLEGFRFYCFLAQPAAIAIGAGIDDVWNRASMQLSLQKHRAHGIGFIILLVLVVMGLGWGINDYGLKTRFQTSGLIIEEYEAARWFRSHSAPNDRIVADYYRGQMLGGVLGGKALLGGMFPLRNVDYDYIKVPARVQDDIYFLYGTGEPEDVLNIAGRYGVTHIFYSDNMMMYGNLLSRYKKASEYGVEVEQEKFLNETCFEIVYDKGNVKIVKILY